jgi:hypothetical protein
MAMACLRLFTFLPEPDFSLPRLNSRISRSTFLWDEGEYFREDFFLEDARFFAEGDLRVEVDFRPDVDFVLECEREPDEDFFPADDVFLLDDFVAIAFSLRRSDGNQIGSGCIERGSSGKTRL